MNASPAEYTLLIVESPTLAERLQAIAPQHVLVFATGGYLWEPRFNPDNGKLGKKTLPEKADLRKELRTEVHYAVKIIVATDRDPSGDFIAWTIFKEIPNSTILRGNLRSISRDSLQNLLDEASHIDFSILFHRLQNRFRIRSCWNREYPEIPMKKAGILAVFGAPTPATLFRSKEGILFRSDRPIESTFKETEFKLSRSEDGGWINSPPLSTFDAVELIHKSSDHGSFHEAQNLLQAAFETKNIETGEGLISYPRTEYQSFFPDTWHNLQQQWILKQSLNEFQPAALQNSPETGAAHDAIHPVNLNVSPQWVERHLPSNIANVYQLVYSYTLKSIKMPERANDTYKYSDTTSVFTTDSEPKSEYFSIKPVVSISELGLRLCRLGVLRPSGFGTFMDQAIKKGWLTLDYYGDVHPGNNLQKNLAAGQYYSEIFKSIGSVADDPDLRIETIRDLLTS